MTAMLDANAGQLYAAAIDAGKWRDLTPEQQRLGEFIGALMFAREGLQHVINEGPDPCRMLIIEQAAKILRRAVWKYEQPNGQKGLSNG
jgi:hypothetical protein